mgnify:CR=1 FL=1
MLTMNEKDKNEMLEAILKRSLPVQVMGGHHGRG